MVYKDLLVLCSLLQNHEIKYNTITIEMNFNNYAKFDNFPAGFSHINNKIPRNASLNDRPQTDQKSSEAANGKNIYEPIANEAYFRNSQS